MPAYMRSEGAELYHNGQVTDVSVGQLTLSANVSGEIVNYDLDGENDFCSCSFFENKNYCVHLAAVEEYLKEEKNSSETSGILVEAKKSQKLNEKFIEGKKFLDLLVDENHSYEDKLSLEADVFESVASGQFYYQGDQLLLTLKLRSRKAQKSYIIKDIPQFLHLVKQEELYQLGKDHLIRLVMDNFDEESQTFLTFLMKITPDDYIADCTIYPKAGRFLLLSPSIIEEGLDLAYLLPNFSMMIDNKKVAYFSFSDLEGEYVNLFNFKIIAGDESIDLKIKKNNFTSFYQNDIIYQDNVFYRPNLRQVKLINQLLGKMSEDNFEISFDYSEKDELAQVLEYFESIGQLDAGESFRIRKFKPIFNFSMDNRLNLSMTFDYGNLKIDSLQDLETVDFSRDLKFEDKIFSLMEESGFPKGFKSSQEKLKSKDFYTFFAKTIPSFEKIGQVNLADDLAENMVNASSDLEVSTKGRLLDISFDLPDINDDELINVIAKLRDNEDHYITESGKLLMFDKDDFDPLRDVLTEFEDNIEFENGKLTLPTYRSFQLAKIFENMDSVTFSEEFKNLYTDLTRPEDFDFILPDNIKADLRSYQLDGVKWMKMLTSHHMGGVLADDMGLGKTLQAITYLASSLGPDDKALVVAPSSLIYNWESEVDKFSDNLDVVVVEGNKQVRSKQISQNHQIYVTSYGSFLKDLTNYQKKDLKYLLMDEAQTVKNANSKTNKALASLKVDTVFALSGTPIENRLDEMWAILNIVMPGLFASKNKFSKTSPELIARAIKPFIMRRKKEDVLTELPDKLEVIQYNDMVENQKVIYLAQLKSMQERISGMDDKEFRRNKIEILSGITRLRQICDTPALFMDDYQGGSGKLDSLTTLLEQIKDSGHRPLVFSQFTKMFDYIEEAMKKVGLASYKLTGSTPAKERLDMVKSFNAGSRDAFLISLKAGGMGLNLTSADVVILVDLWWNPSVEEQAIARAHRMGQKKSVEVIRLITKGTIEERIQDIQASKQNLVATVLDGGISNKEITEDEIKKILGL